MKHPRNYATVPFDGMHVMVVDAGTVIKDERTGAEIEVTDSAMAAKGGVIFCTDAVFEALKKSAADYRS